MSLRDNFSRTLKGESRFVTDILPDNPYFGFTVRSSIARGEILSIHLPEFPEGYMAVGWADIPGKKYLTIFGHKMPVLAEKRIHYFGEPILLLTGPKRSVLKRLANEVRIEYKEEHPVLELEEVPSNLLKDNIRYSRGDLTSAFASSEKIITSEYTTSLQVPFSNEPESTIAIYNDYQTIVYVASHYPFNIRDNLADILNTPKKKLRIIIPDLCSQFGGKLITPVLIAAHAGLLAHKTHKAVKMEYSQNESLSFGVKKHPFHLYCRSSIDKDGKLTAQQIEVQVDTGSHAVLTDFIAGRIITSATNYYHCPNYLLDIVFNKTNKVPMGGFTGIGEEITCFLMEMHINKIASYLDQDPLSWKIHNLKPVSRKKVPPPSLKVLEKVVTISDFKRKHGAYAALAEREENVFTGNKPIRGIGLSLCPHHIIVGYEQATTAYRMEAVFGKDRKLRLRTSIVDIGDSKASLFAMTAARILNIHVSEVILESVDTFKSTDSGALTSSIGVTILNKLVEQCCRSILRKMKKEKPPFIVKKRYRLPDHPEIISTTWEATVVEVELDPITFEICCRGIWSVIDAGRIVNPEIARNHLEAAALINYEYACTEIKATNFILNHFVSGSLDFPPVHIEFHDGDSETRSPRSLGDQPICGVAPAYLNAISQACRLEYTKLPVTPEQIQTFRTNDAN